jgi:capsular polysaccharide biosynthesis protein
VRGAGRRWVAVVALATFLVTGAAGALVVRQGARTYRSTAVLSIDQPSVLLGTAEPGPVLKLQSLRSQYAALLTTQLLLEPIATRVGRSATSVKDDLHVTAAKDSLLVDVAADGPDRTAARTLAEAAADVLITYVSRSQADAAVTRDQQVVLALLSPASASQAVSGGLRVTLTTGMFVGLVCAAGAVVLTTWVRKPLP